MSPVARRGLLHASLTLLAGAAVAQALPLLLGPWLTRLYAPEQFGVYHLLLSVAANVAVIACARYEIALPLARDDQQALELIALCRWLLMGSTTASAIAGVTWAWTTQQPWPLALPGLVAVLALVSLTSMVATRDRAFRALAVARVVQHGGTSALQVVVGLLGAGVEGLLGGALAATMGAAALLGRRLRGGWRVSTARLRHVARAFREFPLLNTPHAFAGALQDTLSLALIAAWQGPAAAGFWGLAMRYLKAPATLVGGAVSHALYPSLGTSGCTLASRQAVRHVMLVLMALATPLVVGLMVFGAAAFEWAFGPGWRPAGDLACGLALYVGGHFVASPLSVVTIAWNAQAWALRLALVGQALFVGSLALGLALGGLTGGGWMVSVTMTGYFGWFFWRLANWPIQVPGEEAT